MNNLDDHRGRLLARAFYDELEKMAMKSPPVAPMQTATIPALKKGGGGPANIPKGPGVVPTPRKAPVVGGASAQTTAVGSKEVKPVKTVPVSPAG